jgi:hypothetical protein
VSVVDEAALPAAQKEYIPRMSSLRLVTCLLLCVLLPACSDGPGSNSDGGAPRTDDFVGSWRYDSGTLTPNMCTVLGMAIPPIPLTGETITITKTDATHINVNAGSACDVAFTVSGAVATAAANSTCAVTVMGVPVTLNITSWTLTLSGTGLSSAESGSAPLGGSACTASGTGTLTRQ